MGGTDVFQRHGKYLLAQGAFGEAGIRDTDIQVFRFGCGVDCAFTNPPFDFGPNVPADSATAIVLQPDTKIVVGGTSSPIRLLKVSVWPA